MRESHFVVNDKKGMAAAVYWSYALNRAYLFGTGWPFNLLCSHTASFTQPAQARIYALPYHGYPVYVTRWEYILAGPYAARQLR
jgi:hypothetical protein